MKRKPIVLAVVSDTHCNSTIGLCPAEGVKLPEAGQYLPSPAQHWLWARWIDYWSWIAELRAEHNAKLYGVVNGDAVDGTTHHGQTQFITADEEAMMWVAQRCFEIPRQLVRKHRGKCWVLKGTRSHVGSAEQALARWMGAEREPTTDMWARYILKLDLYGVRVDIRHHAPSGTTRPWLRGNPANIAAAMIVLEHTTAGLPVPHLAIRSHRHKYADSYRNQITRCVITPAWQLATDFIHKVVPEAIADIGGIAVVIHPDGHYEVHEKLYRPDPPPTHTEP